MCVCVCVCVLVFVVVFVAVGAINNLSLLYYFGCSGFCAHDGVSARRPDLSVSSEDVLVVLLLLFFSSFLSVYFVVLILLTLSHGFTNRLGHSQTVPSRSGSEDSPSLGIRNSLTAARNN